jgi:Uma2 family endonuclease
MLFLRNRDAGCGGQNKFDYPYIFCELDVMVTGIQMRRPDVAYFSDEQIRNEESEPIPAFCIEVVSPTDESRIQTD